MMKKQEQER